MRGVEGGERGGVQEGGKLVEEAGVQGWGELREEGKLVGVMSSVLSVRVSEKRGREGGALERVEASPGFEMRRERVGR